jgi:hypothetical protein
MENASGSPDPHCLLRLPLLHNITTARWVLELPVFYSHEALKASPDWLGYLSALYHPLEEDAFPIDVRCFTFWWHQRLPPSLIARHFAPHILRSPVPRAALNVARSAAGVEHIHFAANGHVVPIGFQGVAWQVVMTSDVRRQAGSPEPQSAGHRPAGGPSLWIPFVTPLRAGSRVEVFHEASDCDVEAARWAQEATYLHKHFRDHPLFDLIERRVPLANTPARDPLELLKRTTDGAKNGTTVGEVLKAVMHPLSGFWVHVAPGSGLWVDVGRSVAAGADGGHDEACALLLARDRSYLPAGPAGVPLLEIARRACGAHLFSLAHLEIARAGRALGVDTVQGLPCDDPLRTTLHRKQSNVCRYGMPLIIINASLMAALRHARSHLTADLPHLATLTRKPAVTNRTAMVALPTRFATWVRPFELLLLGSTCDANGTACAVDRGACPAHGVLSQGRSSRVRHVCHCDSTRAYINCDGLSCRGVRSPG